MHVATLITRPRFGIIYAQRPAAARNVGLADVGIWRHNAYTSECACLNSSIHSGDKFGATIGINGVVAAVIGNKNLSQAIAFGYACRHCEHHAVAKRHNGRLHILLVVTTVGYAFATLQQATLKVLVHKAKRYNHMRNAQTLAMQGRQRQFVVVMVAAIVERNAQCNLVFLFVKQRNAVHSATHYNYRIFHLLFISLNKNLPTAPQHLQKKAMKVSKAWWKSVIQTRCAMPLLPYGRGAV